MPADVLTGADFEIRAPATSEDWDAARRLCWDYRDVLINGTDRDTALLFYPDDRYSALMQRLGVEHAPPDGLLLLAFSNGTAIATGAYHRFGPETAEVKRLFVADEARGNGIAERLMAALQNAARAAGYTRLVLDTHRDLTAARRLYARLGYTETGPYDDVPEQVREVLHYFRFDL